MPQRNSVKWELISLALGISALAAGIVLVVVDAAQPVEAAGFVVSILAAIGWGAQRRS